jgi:hypothetical protein
MGLFVRSRLSGSTELHDSQVPAMNRTPALLAFVFAVSLVLKVWTPKD